MCFCISMVMAMTVFISLRRYTFFPIFQQNSQQLFQLLLLLVAQRRQQIFLTCTSMVEKVTALHQQSKSAPRHFPARLPLTAIVRFEAKMSAALSALQRIDSPAEIVEQPASVAAAIRFDYGWMGAIISAILLIGVLMMDVEKYLPKIRESLGDRKPAGPM